MTEPLVKPHERVDDLQRNGLRIIQNPSAFRFGMDAVLLADFTRLKPRDRVADMGTGTGILPLLLSQNEPTATFDAIELQPDMADMAMRSVRLNGLEGRILVWNADMRNAWTILGRASVHAVVCNPPYGKQGGAIGSENEGMRLSRHETDLTIREVASSCAAILRNHGRLSVAFPAARFLELCDALRESRLEPKRVRMVCGKAHKPPYLALVEAMKNARPGLLWLPPLVVYEADGRVTAETLRIYHRL